MKAHRSEMEYGKRRIRKGTRSCWECKRKKTRCTFSKPTDSICNGCKRRGTLCISQEFPEGISGTRGHLGDRLGVVEELVGKLIEDNGGANLSQKSFPGLGAVTSDILLESNLNPEQEYSGAGPHPGGVLAAPDPSNGSRCVPEHGCHWFTLISDTIDIRRDIGGIGRYARVSQALLEAWPNKNDRDIILRVGVGSTGFFCGVVCTPYSGLASSKIPSPEDIIEIPRIDTHPVLIARKLIMVGAYLQGFPPKKIQELIGLSTSHYQLMHRAVETAVRLVTSNEDFVGSVEGIESVLIESMFQNSEGNLRRAYLSMRRALVLAQMIGLDKAKNSDSPLLNFIDPETRRRIDPQQMWFRLLQSDRYLSLMLGLPQGTVEDTFATAGALEGRTPMERLERIDCSAAGRIIQRNAADMHDIEVTRKIDKMLQDTAGLMPPKWWLAPDLSVRAIDGIDAIHDTIRLINQFTHYHLLERLHLPYLLHSSSDPKYDYSKITAIIASRELLSRFIPFRGSRTVGSFCRGLDFLAFTAGTALCLAHISAHHQRVTGANEGSALLSFLSHQRPSDRGMLEKVLENMTDAARTRNDTTATKIASITRHLLSIEADAALDGIYTTDSSYNPNNEEEIEYNGKITDGGAVLRIYIPYLGTIKIERHGFSRSDSIPRLPHSSAPLFSEYRPAEQQQTQVDQDISLMASPHSTADMNTFITQDLNLQWLDSNVDLSDGWDLQGVDLAFFDSIFRFCGDE
ncbi:hypothetical protein TWF730_010117 [Orbilia blumenaviensis]|uniref:Zn(2)-C6 fungal-type domain-containing protein n=1 Tax=Orbilia blumenaviensis TaxID=1796055 RepID=A0AAV9UU09_9PEZI